MNPRKIFRTSSFCLAGLFGGLLAWSSVAEPSAVAAKGRAPQPAAAALGSRATAAKNSLHFTRFGKGPGVIFLHALGGDSSVFIDEMQRLSSTHSVLLVDLPGHGMSKDPPAHIELSVIARQVADLIRAQHLAPAVVVGHSLGGTLAGYVALTDPQAVRALVVVDSMFAPYPISQTARDKLRFQLGRDRIRALREFYGPMAHDNAQLDKLVAAASRVSGQTLMNYLDFVSDRDDLQTRIRDITMPVHVVASPLLTEDQNDPARIMAALGQAGYAGLPNLTYSYLPNTKHWVFWDDAAGFHSSLETFLHKVEASIPVASNPAPLGKKGRSLAKAAH